MSPGELALPGFDCQVSQHRHLSQTSRALSVAVARDEPPPGTMSAVSETPSAASSQGATAAPSGGFRSWPRWSRWSTYGVGMVVLLLVAALVAGVVVVRDS